ncbi:hypothetical protein NSK_008781 [Nannochloropsis salina CCMP1776]|uniref:Uncharacterized protein n=1 Tax=Nannochloropsis salina CCMP1776 TaxID=1027361 RepID=A0A4D9CQP5_9STRA|nr:hypothetical protein NSK_008781 [Nannochloropsis salina CCMP1776]|eukprot:TFJ79883.1 hypothetical protein NSK_008781 [Nannochloropsis salina CCMP1776]
MASGSVERKRAGKGGLPSTCVALEGGACVSIHPSRSCVHNRSRKATPDPPKHEAGAHGQVERAGVFQETLHVGEARCQALAKDRPKRGLWLWCALREWIERPPECIGWREPRRSTR